MLFQDCMESGITVIGHHEYCLETESCIEFEIERSSCHYKKLGQQNIELIGLKRMAHQQRNMAFNVMTNIHLNIPVCILIGA